ncbi:hypothetical protein [Rathayibacter soli]|uniref:hypothetical protein n=1 Tax=Rathayibacter soli TaxID=3144168 RepID=UPI0027E51B08|nr:hypothetical protein [Glaciibacter superstes]
MAAVLALASALAMGVAMMAAPQSAHATSAIDGQWTVVHGGTGQVSLNADGTYTSTCQVNPDYADAWCPAPSGTFQYSTMSTASVTFTGADGSTTSYRVSGLVSSPDTITSVFGSRTYSPLVMKKGNNFVCTDWSGTGTSFTQWGISPEVQYDAASSLLYATGSHDLIGPNTIDTQVNLAETAPDYFQTGSCAGGTYTLTLASFIHVDSFSDATVGSSTPGTWTPQATVAIKDLAGVPVSGATVGAYSAAVSMTSCITSADGTCTLSGATLADTVTSVDLRIISTGVVKAGTQFMQYPAPSSLLYLTINQPTGSTPPPASAVDHIGDLDNATTAVSSKNQWRPQVTATVLDAAGVAVSGATVSGTFTNYKGTVTCVTAADGTCTLGNISFPTRTTSTVFTVTNVVKASSTYAPTANTDPDGDSNGTTITVNRP